MTILFQRLFLVLFIFSTVFSVVNGQRDGEDDDTEKDGGIFEGKTKAKSGGGGDGDCTDNYDTPGYFQIGVNLDLSSSQLPCNLHIGVTDESGVTLYFPISVEVQESSKFGEPIYGVSDILYPHNLGETIYCPESDKKLISSEFFTFGIAEFTLTVDFYCKVGEDFINISPCGTDMFDDILPDDIEDECDLATEITMSVCCFVKPPHNLSDENDISTRGIKITNQFDFSEAITLLNINGQVVTKGVFDNYINESDFIKSLEIPSGLYIISQIVNGKVLSKKVIID